MNRFFEEGLIDGLEKSAACATPGRKIRSKGKGRGLAQGGGRGPAGIPGEGLEKKSGPILKIIVRRLAEERKKNGPRKGPGGK